MACHVKCAQSIKAIKKHAQRVAEDISFKRASSLSVPAPQERLHAQNVILHRPGVKDGGPHVSFIPIMCAVMSFSFLPLCVTSCHVYINVV